MASPIEEIIRKMLEVGFFDIIIFVISAAIFYAILKKFKLLGESPLINGAIAAGIAFLIFGYPVIVGFSLTLPLTTFFAHSFVWILTFFMAFMLASFFYPDLPKFLAEKFTSRSMISIAIVIGIVIALLSGLAGVLLQSPAKPGTPQTPLNVTTTIGAVLLFVIILIVAGSMATGGVK
jgi:hypothetical protein